MHNSARNAANMDEQHRTPGGINQLVQQITGIQQIRLISDMKTPFKKEIRANGKW